MAFYRESFLIIFLQAPISSALVKKWMKVWQSLLLSHGEAEIHWRVIMSCVVEDFQRKGLLINKNLPDMCMNPFADKLNELDLGCNIAILERRKLGARNLGK
ncbi:hypothetical protein GGR56DRAFT_649132 [Xylariaceae sp. FL0804]|nr:hypothetical protein GGR56DRAFT_649132 [Xylariaceae sp. FL0804]